jgi:hypothetical protein
MAEESNGESTAQEVNAEAASEEAKVTEVADAVEGEVAAAAPPTVRDIFALPANETDPSSAEWKTFQERISDEIKGIKWTAATPELAGKICELLDIKIPNILVTAWKKAKEIQSVLEKSRSSPDEVTYLELAEHTINSDHRPSIDVRLKGATVKKVELPIQLAFKLKGFVLKIQNGGIKEMQTGQCEAKGTIKYGGLTIAEKKLEPIKFPFTIAIPPSIGFPSSPAIVPATETAPEIAAPHERIEL